MSEASQAIRHLTVKSHLDQKSCLFNGCLNSSPIHSMHICVPPINTSTYVAKVPAKYQGIFGRGFNNYHVVVHDHNFGQVALIAMILLLWFLSTLNVSAGLLSNESQALPGTSPVVERTFFPPHEPWAINGIHWPDCEQANVQLTQYHFPAGRCASRGCYWSRNPPRRSKPGTEGAVLPLRFFHGSLASTYPLLPVLK